MLDDNGLNHAVRRSIRPLMLEYQAMKKRMLYHLRVHMRRIYGVLTDLPVKFQSISNVVAGVTL